jgi:tRNA threonylcarbamoyladenosine biosynthesis protein TsaB
MRILAFDTSTDWLSVAAGDGTLWHAHEERAGQGSSERILPAIDALLALAHWQLADLDGIAFGAGPGAFTGVRIACGVAQGLAFGADLPLLAVPTTEALAQDAWRKHQATRVFACMDARMREVYVAAYARDRDQWRVVREPDVMRPEDVALPEGEGWHGAGDGFAAYPKLAALSRLVSVDATAHPGARAIGELALPRLAAGLGVPAADALPLYVRHRVALTSAERDAGQRMP